MSELNSIKINGVEIPLEKICEECGGDGHWCNDLGLHECEACYNGEESTGKQPIYYTPEQIEEDHGIKFIGNFSVWVKMYSAGPYVIRGSEELLKRDKVLLCFPFQPAPPADYKIKE